MWWGGKLSGICDILTEETPSSGSFTFSVPEEAFENIGRNVELLNMMDGKESLSKSHVERGSLALPGPQVLDRVTEQPQDPFEAFDAVSVTGSMPAEEYWSMDKSFWLKWKEDETRAKLNTKEAAHAKLEEVKRETALAAEEAKKAESLRIEKEKQEAAAAKMKAKVETTQASVNQAAKNSTPAARGINLNDFKSLMEEGKQFRSEFMPCWREISLAVSTTAANARSIQINSSKIVTALSRAASQCGTARPQVVRWLCSVCGSKIVSQAATGNKTLVWSFAYLARIVAEKFPDVGRVGMLGELASANEHLLLGADTASLPDKPADFEMYARVWVSIMCVFGDQHEMWKWTSSVVNRLRRVTNFIQSGEALWSMMLVYILFDVGLYDFKRMFGAQANMLIDLLEKTVFPKADTQLQACQQPTSASVQLRFYLDACFNIIQSRKYASPPDGQVLQASRESELNPEL